MATGLFGASPRADAPGLVALEFYSGIGGLRVSLEKAVEATTCETTFDSYEINSVANSVRENRQTDRQTDTSIDSHQVQQ